MQLRNRSETGRLDGNAAKSRSRRVGRSRCPGLKADAISVSAPDQAGFRERDVVMRAASGRDRYRRNMRRNRMMELRYPCFRSVEAVRQIDGCQRDAVKRSIDERRESMVMRDDALLLGAGKRFGYFRADRKIQTSAPSHR